MELKTEIHQASTRSMVAAIHLENCGLCVGRDYSIYSIEEGWKEGMRLVYNIRRLGFSTQNDVFQHMQCYYDKRDQVQFD